MRGSINPGLASKFHPDIRDGSIRTGVGLMVLPILSIAIVGITLLLLRSKLALDGSGSGFRQVVPASVGAERLAGGGSN